MARFFNARQRRHLYRRHQGRCAKCDTPLLDSWHADHITPYAAGGKTNVANGQPLCPTCNLKKGSNVEYSDEFEPRPFQTGVIESVLDGFATSRQVTVALGTPGTGKTLAYQGVATYLLREGLIDHVAVFVPRVSLAQQCETSWLYADPDTRELHGLHKLFDARLRFGKIRHSDARPPLTQPNATGTGFVSTYSALAIDPATFTDWAETHRGRFLLVADEAQFCGASDDNGGGTRAGALIREMDAYAAHTLLLTGTPYRADGRELVLAEYADTNEDGDPWEDGKRRLIRHVEATYADGIDGEYLRPFEMLLHDGKITETDICREWSMEYSMSSRESNLGPVLRLPTTWQPMVNMVVKSVRDKQAINPAYRGLISCMEKKDAEAVTNYLRTQHPGLRVHLAVSSDGAAAQRSLQDFKTEPADVLVTVRMAFIGYDCPLITVVGVLTHYRDAGHLMQLVGRGLRVWDQEPFAEQSCQIIVPDDPRMQEFLGKLRREQDEGLRRREAREPNDGTPSDDNGTGALTFIDSTEMTTVRAVSNNVEVEHDERILLDAIKRQLGLTDTITNLAAFAELLAIRSKNAPQTDEASTEFPVDAPVQQGPVLTEKQQIEKKNSETAAEIKQYLADRGIAGGRSDYGKRVGKVTALVNEVAGCSAKQVRTVEDAESRLQAARKMRGAP